MIGQRADRGDEPHVVGHPSQRGLEQRLVARRGHERHRTKSRVEVGGTHHPREGEPVRRRQSAPLGGEGIGEGEDAEIGQASDVWREGEPNTGPCPDIRPGGSIGQPHRARSL